MMKTPELKGVVVPMITPVTNNDDVDVPAFRKILRRLIPSGIHAIFVGGSAGEGPLLSAVAWRQMVEVAREEVADNVVLLGGVMDTSTRRVCERIHVLRGLGYRWFVLTPTFYTPGRSPSEQLRLFEAAREAGGDMEMVAYNLPQCTGAPLAVETVCEMAKRGWIRYCKESSGDWDYLSALLRAGKNAGLNVLAGDEKIAGQGLLAGACGIVPVCANYDPQAYIRLFQAGERGDAAAVEAAMKRVMVLREELPLSGACWITGIKYAMSVLGMGTGRPVSPLEPADAKQKARIEALIRSDKMNG